MKLLGFKGNYIDLIVFIIFIFFVSEGVRLGFWIMLADFLSFLTSLILSLKFYQILGGFLGDNFSLSHSLANALGFLIMAIISEGIIGYLFGLALSRVPKSFKKSSLNRYLAAFPALGEALVIVAFIFTLVLALPVSPQLKKDVTESQIAGKVIEKTQGVETKLNDIFGGVVEDSITYLTIKPGSTQKVILRTQVGDLQVDGSSEEEMFNDVNRVRSQAAVSNLTWDESLAAVARDYAAKMWRENYFGHISSTGEDVGDRLKKAGIDYFVAGENLALAPAESIAFTGLMNSEGHRANILEPQFEKIGIGVVDNGIYGKMFVQIFVK